MEDGGYSKNLSWKRILQIVVVGEGTAVTKSATETHQVMWFLVPVGRHLEVNRTLPLHCLQQDFGIFSSYNELFVVIAVEESGLRTQFCFNKMS